MAKIFRQLKVEPVQFSEGTLKTRQLPFTVYRGLHFRLEVNHDNAVDVSLSKEDIASLITKLSVVLNGQDTIVSVPGFFLPIMNSYDFSYDVFFYSDGSTGTGKKSVLSFYLPFALTRAIRPQDTLLDARRPKVSSIVLEVQWGVPNIANVTVTGATLHIETAEYSNVREDEKFARHEFGWDTVNLDAIGLIQHKLEVGGNNQYRRLWLFTNQDGFKDGLVGAFGVRSRSFYFLNRDAEDIKALNQIQFSRPAQSGVYVLDFTTDGMMSQRLDARNLSELVLEVQSLINNGKLEVVKEKAIYA